MAELSLTEINIYPIKSLGGISLSTSIIEDRGLKYDRRWMLIDENNMFITQRKFSLLSLLKVKLLQDGLEVSTEGFGSLKIYFNEAKGKKRHASIWDDTCEVVEVSKEADEWFSTFLNNKVTLVFMPENTRRLVDQKYAYEKEVVSFADGFPLLLIGQASLTDLNSRLAEPLPMNRFRPNIVVNTSAPFEEDDWKGFSIGKAHFLAVKPCSRCIVTTIDQSTGVKNAEPLKTLSTYRNFNNKVMFGQNLLYTSGDNKISVGDKVIVKNKK